MKSAVLRLLEHRKSFYLSCVVASAFLIISLLLAFYTDLPPRFIGLLIISSVCFYTFSWIAYVWSDRKTTTMLIRQSSALRIEIVERNEAVIKGLAEAQDKLFRSFNTLEKNLGDTLDKHQESYVEELKTQAFHSHLAVQELKSFTFTERDHDG